MMTPAIIRSGREAEEVADVRDCNRPHRGGDVDWLGIVMDH
jgi:hypothetical protein